MRLDAFPVNHGHIFCMFCHLKGVTPNNFTSFTGLREHENNEHNLEFNHTLNDRQKLIDNIKRGEP